MAAISIAYITDIHLGQKVLTQHGPKGNKMGYELVPTEHRDNFIAILDDVVRRGLREVVFGGDIGTANSIPWFFRTIQSYGVHLRLTLGNHDRYAHIYSYLDNSFGSGTSELYFAQEDDSCKTIFLDSSSNAISAVQLEWLSRVLVTPKQIHLFVHHPVLPIDTPLDRLGAALIGREKLKLCLEASGRPVTIFCGHYHMIDEARDGMLQQYSSPAASYQIVKEAKGLEIDSTYFGYRIITITDHRFTTEVVLLKPNQPDNPTSSATI